MNSLELFSLPWFLALAAVMFACFLRGVTGFGQNLVLAPILVLLIEPRAVVVTNLILAITSSLLLLPYVKRHFKPGKVLPLAAGALAGIPLGTLCIKVIDASALKVLIGGLTVAFAIPIALGTTLTFRRQRLASIIAGLVSGAVNASTSLGGPPLVLFMYSQKWAKELSYASLAIALLGISGLSLVALALSGLVDSGTTLGALSLLPALAIGLFIGTRVFSRMNVRAFRLLGIGVVIVSGIVGVLSGMGIW